MEQPSGDVHGVTQRQMIRPSLNIRFFFRLKHLEIEWDSFFDTCDMHSEYSI